MVEIKQSYCKCGKCGNIFPVKWELEMQDTPDTGLDMGVTYCGETEEECFSCGNLINAELQATEKPIGVLENVELTFVGDSFNTGLTQVEEPQIFFFDR